MTRTPTAGTTLRAITTFTCLVLLAFAAGAQETGSISGRVADEEGDPVDDAIITLIELRLQTAVDAQGQFQFDNLAPTSYLLQVDSDRFGSLVERLEVAAGPATEVDLQLGRHHHNDQIVVTGSAQMRSQLELASPITVLTGEALSLKVQPTLGDTLSQEAGVNQTYFAPGASRPIVRGLGGDRVRMLQGGLSSGDVSSTSPDHAVGVDPATAERIEVLRGPSTLLYGSTAIGGVVNVIDNSIPSLQPTESVTGQVDLRGGTVANEVAARLDLNGGAGSWAWHLDGAVRQTGDYAIPDEYHPAEFADGHEEDEEFERGTLQNSDLETTSVAAGLSYFGAKGFLGVAISGFDSNYGVPGHSHGDEHGDGVHDDAETHEGEDHEEESVRIDLERRRIDLNTEITQAFGPFRGFKARLGVIDYEHNEMEGDTVGTRFLKNTFEGRFEFVQQHKGQWSGSFGLQILDDDLEAIGDEAFLPPSASRTYGIFAFEELTVGDLAWQFGARLEASETTTKSRELPDRSFTPFSLSVGLVWELPGEWSLGSSLARSQKAPNAGELYSDGPHAATRTYEVGDPTLSEETSLGFDLSIRRGGEPLHGEFTLFLNRFDDFIYERMTGDVIEGFPVLQFTQADAEFMGGELEIEYDLWEAANRHLDLTFMSDFVRAELRATGEALPFIPPFRIGTGLHYGSQRWHAAGDIRWTAEQNRVAENELPTPSYTMLNASAGYRFFWKNQVVDLLLRARNLTDELAFNASSVSKFERPMPGRDVQLSVKLLF